MGEVLKLACEMARVTEQPRPRGQSVPVLNPEKSGPNTVCPGVYRSITQVDPVVLDTFADLVAGSRPWPLYLWGPCGTGKSCAAAVLCDYTRGLYWSMDEIVDELFESYRGSGSGATSLWGDVASPPLAVLDEIGGRAVSDTVYGAVKHFWESRQKRGGVAVYCSNLSPDALADAFDDRIASRLLSGTVLELSGKDRRLQ